MSKRKTHEEFVTELSVINPNIEVIGVYVNNSTKILCRCKVDANEWHAIPTNLLKGKGCPFCGRVNLKTHDQYVYDVSLANKNIDVVGTYVNNSTKILHKCKIDGFEWYARPNNILNGAGCPVCSRKLKTTTMFKNELFEINKNIDVVSDYINNKTKVHCICKIDGYEWDTLPGNLLKGCGCPVCSGTKYKTHDEYVIDVAKVNGDIDVIGTYINARTKILHKCKIDGTEWMADPHHILSGRGCPTCSISYGEIDVRNYLHNNNIVFERQYTFDGCINKNKLPFDFYLPDYNLCIEYDGEQHFKPIERFGGNEAFLQRQINDSIKNKFCLSNNILLLRIKYCEDVTSVLDDFFNNLTIQK